jgi:hypothetical protein
VDELGGRHAAAGAREVVVEFLELDDVGAYSNGVRELEGVHLCKSAVDDDVGGYLVVLLDSFVDSIRVRLVVVLNFLLDLWFDRRADEGESRLDGLVVILPLAELSFVDS